ncbi:MAG: hypothetical protein CMP25_00690 [Rickettsiales bacterium]|nr:hypothetical protein [Rickettsiales bacterium]
MFKIDKIILIELQLIISLIFRVIIRILEYSKFLSFSLFFALILVLNDLWPKNESLKFIFLILFILLNLIYFVFYLNSIEKENFINLKKIRILLQKKLSLTNYELFSIKDTKNVYEEKNKNELWLSFINSIKKTIRDKYTFKIEYFFLIEKNIDNLTKLSVLIWFSISYLLISNNYYKDFTNSFTLIKNNNSSFVDIGMNIWIIPKNEINQDKIFVGNFDMDNEEMKSFLVQDGSKLLINFYNAKKKNIKVLIKNKNESVLSKKFILKNSDLLEYNEQVQEGEYNIFYKKKVIKRFVIIKDKPPNVKFITKPEISKDKNIKFKYTFKDENNLFVWLEISKLETKKSDNLKIDVKDFNKTLSQPKNYIILMKNRNSTKLELDLLFEKNLSYLPSAGKEVFIRIGANDLNDQIGFSKTFSLILPKKKFNDKLAKKLMVIREDLINGKELSLISKKIKKKEFLKTPGKAKEMIEDILFYYEKNNSNTQEKREVLVNELWNVAIFLEAENLENLEKEISDLREEIARMINSNFSEELLSSKVMQLERLLEKYKKRTESDNFDEFNIKDKDLEKQQNESQQSFSTLEKAKRLLNEIDNLINKDNLKENKSKILQKLQEIYKNQKILVDESFFFKEKMTNYNRNTIYKKQEDIFKTFKGMSNDIEKIIPNEKEIINNILNDFQTSLNSLNSHNSEFFKNQIRLLENIKKLFLKLLENAKDKKTKNKENNNGLKKNRNSNEFDVPIIFEENQYNKLIERIRRMTNEDGREEEEKKYLKRLLPDF